MLELRWFQNGIINFKKFYDTKIMVEFKNKLLKQGIKNINVYYKNKKVSSFDSNNMFLDELDNVQKELSAIQSIADIYLITYETEAIDEDNYEQEYYKNNKGYWQDKLTVVMAELNYVMDTYPLNRKKFHDLCEEYLKIKRRLEK